MDFSASRRPRAPRDPSKFTAGDLIEIQRSMNRRPRKTLSFMVPDEKLAEFVALTG